MEFILKLLTFIVSGYATVRINGACISATCPDAFPVTIENFCYLLEPNKLINYDKTVSYCSSMTGQISQFLKQSDYDSFIQWWSRASQTASTIARGTHSFIGLRSNVAKGTTNSAAWHWEIDNKTSITYNDWYTDRILRPPQPENECGTCTCSRLRYDAGPVGTVGYWFDTNCLREDCSALCQFDMNTYCPAPTLDHGEVIVTRLPIQSGDSVEFQCNKCCTLSGSSKFKCKEKSCTTYDGVSPTCKCDKMTCLDGWTASGTFCYKSLGSTANYNDAIAKCQGESGSRLPEFPSLVDYEEFAIVWTTMIGRRTTWIGLEKQTSSAGGVTTDRFIWTNSGNQLTYKPDWYTALANHYYNCVAMIDNNSGRWVSDYSCASGFEVICQLDCGA